MFEHSDSYKTTCIFEAQILNKNTTIQFLFMSL